MGKSTISMAIFNSYVTNYQRVMPKKTGFGRSYAAEILGLMGFHFAHRSQLHGSRHLLGKGGTCGEFLGPKMEVR